VGISVYMIDKLEKEAAIAIGNKCVGSHKKENVAGYCFNTIGEVNQICVGHRIPEFKPELWPLPHIRHLNLSPTITDAQAQLRCQVLAKQMSKIMTSEVPTYHTEHF
jgi:hypothetical protein